ncbi:hypothetical protein C0Q70_01093 [Pomacea canaliculata]|uniref:Uncharacterized protein n=1 Tax=Pomacea canaliculata TaxID=400727 RepID=A0A2T7PYJ8_POMCA|nr:hypothetical protein C0Q70_01093 [Pomacea canaliculata]
MEGGAGRGLGEGWAPGSSYISMTSTQPVAHIALPENQAGRQIVAENGNVKTISTHWHRFLSPGAGSPSLLAISCIRPVSSDLSPPSPRVTVSCLPTINQVFALGGSRAGHPVPFVSRQAFRSEREREKQQRNKREKQTERNTERERAI